MKESLFSGLFGSLLQEGAMAKPVGFHSGGLIQNLYPYQRAFLDQLLYIPRKPTKRISADTRTMLDDLERNRPTMDPMTTRANITTVTVTVRNAGRGVTSTERAIIERHIERIKESLETGRMNLIRRGL